MNEIEETSLVYGETDRLIAHALEVLE